MTRIQPVFSRNTNTYDFPQFTYPNTMLIWAIITLPLRSSMQRRAGPALELCALVSGPIVNTDRVKKPRGCSKPALAPRDPPATDGILAAGTHCIPALWKLAAGNTMKRPENPRVGNSQSVSLPCSQVPTFGSHCPVVPILLRNREATGLRGHSGPGAEPGWERPLYAQQVLLPLRADRPAAVPPGGGGLSD